MTNFFTFFTENYKPRWSYIETLPCFSAMKDCKHSSYWHEEGNPFEHTKLVVDTACSRIDSITIFQNEDDRTIYRKQAMLMAALFHDIAKPVVTTFDEKKNDWTAPNHAEEGAKMTRMILMEMDYEDAKQRELIVSLVRMHMKMHHILDRGLEKTKIKLYPFVTDMNEVFCSLEEAAYLCFFDSMGSICKDEPESKKYNHLKNTIDLKYLYFDDDGFQLKESIFLMGKNKNIIKEKLYGIPTNGNEIEVNVLIGLPGCGKSTYAKDLGLPIISRDIARFELGFCEDGEKYIGNSDEENKVTEYVKMKMLEYADKGINFTIDNTHLRQAYRDDIHKTLKNYNVKYNYIYIEAPTLTEDIKRREKEGFGNKSEFIIKRMLMSFEFPYPYEYDKLIFIKQK